MKKWLIVPGVVFVVIFIILVLLLPKPEKVSTTVSASPTPTSTNRNGNTTQKSVYQNIYDQIMGFTPEDPKLTAPNFDRKISLPKEE